MKNYVLGKIGKLEHMKELVDNGTVYMRKLSHYVGLESRVRGDKNEGLYYRVSDKNPTLKVFMTPEGGEPIPLEVASISINSTARDHGVYCMYGINTTGLDEKKGNLVSRMRPLVDEMRLHEFGDWLVLFKDSPEFVRRVQRAAKEAGHEIDHEPVEYMPETHCGEMGPFRKLDSYAYQNEVRFLTGAPIEGDTLGLNVGPLGDIVLAVDLQEWRKAG